MAAAVPRGELALAIYVLLKQRESRDCLARRLLKVGRKMRRFLLNGDHRNNLSTD